MDLGKAFALRAQQEKRERIAAEQLKQEEARQRREARAKLEALLEGKALNDAAAEIARHFEYGGKIKRIYVTAPQLKALNAGELGVVQLNGRYLLVEGAVLAEAEAVFPAAVGEYDMAAQFVTQIKAVLLTLAWSGIGSAVLYFAVDKLFGLRPTEEAEREGLDLSEHGERAYNY